MQNNNIEHLKILYLEDDLLIRKVVLDTLGEHIHHLLIGNDGNEGLALYALNRPDLIITDLKMPVLNGLDFIKKIRAQDPEIPIIVTSGLTDVNTLIQSIELRVDKYILKPFSPDEILSAVYMFNSRVMNTKLIRSNFDLACMPKDFIDNFLSTVRNFISSYIKEVTGRGASKIVIALKNNKIEVVLHESFSALELTLANKVYDAPFINALKKKMYEQLATELNKRLSYVSGTSIELESVSVSIDDLKEKLIFSLGVFKG